MAHIFLAEKCFGKLNNNIKLGSIIPDFISLSPNITISETHVIMQDLGHGLPDFERAWNLHIVLDEYTEKNFFYPKIPKKIEKQMGRYVAHLFVETVLDYLMWSAGVYYEPPRFDEKIINQLEVYFDKDFTFIKPTIQLFINWDIDSYLDHLQYSLLYICGYHQHILTKSQVHEIIQECKTVLPNYEELLTEFLDNIALD